MVIIANNPSTTETVTIQGLVSILPGESSTLTALYELHIIQSNSDLLAKIVAGKIIISNGIQNLSSIEAVRFIMGLVPVEPREPTGKMIIQASPRALYTVTVFTGVGDDDSNPTVVGNGQPFIMEHNIGDPNPGHLYLDWNIIENETWIKEGYINFSDAKFDTITFEVVPRVIEYTQSSNTNYMLYNGYLVLPAASNGDIEITSDLTSPVGGLVKMNKSYEGVRPVAFWNADWNSTTKLFENIVPAPSGDGNYNIFATEIVLARFVNKIPFLGSGNQGFVTTDISQLGHGMRLKCVYHTHGDDHAWKACCVLFMYRRKTV